jgi:hypothetical protein
MSLFNVHSALAAGIIDALIAAEAMKTIVLTIVLTIILLMIELHCSEESYSSAGLSAIARESSEVRLWLRRINLGLEKRVKGLFDVRRAISFAIPLVSLKSSLGCQPQPIVSA